MAIVLSGSTNDITVNGVSVATDAEVSYAVERAVPAGTIIIFAAITAPDGHLKANGALVSRTVYSALFAAIGTTFGAGDGSTTFALPDLRAYFPRGFDDGRGIDNVSIASWSYSGTTITINTTGNHDVTVGQKVTISGLVSTTNAPNGDRTVVTTATAKSFTFIATATPTGTATVSSAKVSRTFGSSQQDAMEVHRHSTGTDGVTLETPNDVYIINNKTINGITYGTSNQSSGGGYNSGTTSIPLPSTLTGSVSTSSETRPKNIALLYCIKY